MTREEPANAVGRLVERCGDAGRVFLVSPRLEALGIRHGFTTRLGGVNVRTAADLAGFLADAGLPGERVFLGPQPHGRRVSSPEDRAIPADAHGSPPGGEAVAVRTADCLAVLLAGPRGVVAAHAGWRGLLAGVLPAAIEALGGERGVRAAAIGPCIAAAAFEVGPEVAAGFRAAGLGAQVAPGRVNRSHADLLGAALEQLAAAGIGWERIDVAARCTSEEAASFYSYRRDGAGSGHQAAWIQPERESAY